MTLILHRDPFFLQACDEVRGGDYGVMPITAWHRSLMRIFTDDPRLPIAKAAADSCDERDRLIRADQHRSLLDVKFKIGGHGFRFQIRDTRCHRCRIKPKFDHMLA